MNAKENRKMDREERCYDQERYTEALIERLEDVHGSYDAPKYTLAHPRAKTALVIRTRDFEGGWINRDKVKAWTAKFKGPWPTGGRHEAQASLDV